MPRQMTILVACHLPYPVPEADGYLPVEVGAALHDTPIPGFTGDNTGDNISRFRQAVEHPEAPLRKDGCLSQWTRPFIFLRTISPPYPCHAKISISFIK